MVVPVRTVQEAVAAGDLPQLDADATNIFVVVCAPSTLLQLYLVTRLRRHAAGPGQRQQALRGEHLDVAVRPGQPPDGVYRRGGKDQGRAALREQDQGGRDEEVLQRGRCRSGGGARQRRSGLNTGL